jgi:hypothetical protein
LESSRPPLIKRLILLLLVLLSFVSSICTGNKTIANYASALTLSCLPLKAYFQTHDYSKSSSDPPVKLTATVTVVLIVVLRVVIVVGKTILSPISGQKDFNSLSCSRLYDRNSIWL